MDKIIVTDRMRENYLKINDLGAGCVRIEDYDSRGKLNEVILYSLEDNYREVISGDKMRGLVE